MHCSINVKLGINESLRSFLGLHLLFTADDVAGINAYLRPILNLLPNPETKALFGLILPHLFQFKSYGSNRKFQFH